MANYPGYGYGYPYPAYFMPEWHTTYVLPHFPEKHHHLEHIRLALNDSIGNVGSAIKHSFAPEPQTLNPVADVLESNSNYYIEIELPGLEATSSLKIRWLNPHTLMVEAILERPAIVEEQVPAARAEVATTVTASKDTKFDSKPEVNGDTTDQVEAKQRNSAVVLTHRERHIGLFARAFHFPTQVVSEHLEAKMHAGLLRIKVPKLETDSAKPEMKAVEVEHSGA